MVRDRGLKGKDVSVLVHGSYKTVSCVCTILLTGGWGGGGEGGSVNARVTEPICWCCCILVLLLWYNFSPRY